MTRRAVIIGFALGVLVSGASFFNTHIMGQADLIGSHFPVAVFGILLAALMVLNPLMFRLAQRWALRKSEVAVAGAIALAACGWSATVPNILTGLGTPAYWHRVKPAWQAQKVFSYIPDASPEFAYGHVSDWFALARQLDRESAEPLQRRVGEALSVSALQAVRRIINRREGAPRDQRVLLAGLNQLVRRGEFHHQVSEDRWPSRARTAQERRRSVERALGRTREQIDAVEQRIAVGEADRGDAEAVAELRRRLGSESRGLLGLAGFYERQMQHHDRHATRALIVSIFPDQLKPAPRGRGVLPAGGRHDSYVTNPLMLGSDDEVSYGIAAVPWVAWRSALITWGGLTFVLGLAAFALVWVIHPQWSHHEQLTYPIPRIISELSDRFTDRSEGSIFRRVGSLFWVAFGAVLGIHMVNYLNAWFPEIPAIPVRFDFTPLRRIMPYVAQAPGAAYRVWQPTLFFTVIGFAYFLPRQISLSLGLSGYTWVIFCGLLIRRGVAVEFSSMVFPIRFGAQLAFLLMILYLGRAYSLAVLTTSVGLRARLAVTSSAVWGARAAAVCTVLAVCLLQRAGLDWSVAIMFVLLMLMLSVVLTRISVETGLFYLYPGWAPPTVLVGLLGVEGLGPTGFIVVAVAAGMLIPGFREALMPFLANGLELVRRAEVPRTRVAAPVLGMIVLSLVIAVGATFFFAYGHGVANLPASIAYKQPTAPFELATSVLSDLGARGELSDTTGVSGPGSWLQIAPDGSRLGWMGFGFVAVAICAVARLRWAWWPIHPILFLLWGIWPLLYFCFPFLLGWAIKTATVRVSGVGGFQRGKPLMLGLITADLIGALITSAIGFVYYFSTGIRPPAFTILGPG